MTTRTTSAAIFSALLRNHPIPRHIVCRAVCRTIFSTSDDVRRLDGLSLQPLSVDALAATILSTDIRHLDRALSFGADNTVGHNS
jgi:hypothetical protein